MDDRQLSSQFMVCEENLFYAANFRLVESFSKECRVSSCEDYEIESGNCEAICGEMERKVCYQ